MKSLNRGLRRETMVKPFRRRSRRVDPHQTSVGVWRTFRAQIIFVTIHPGRVVLDLMTEPGEYTTVFVSLEAFVPRTLWAQVAAAQLDKWAASSTDIELGFRCSNGGYPEGKPTVKLSDGRTLVVLDLCRAPDLPGDPDTAAQTQLQAPLLAPDTWSR